MNIVFNELAVLEFKDAVDYYQLQVSGLGEIFSEEIRKALRSIKIHPDAWPSERGDIKKFILHKFPYKILYSIESDYIYIIAIAHQHRKPEYWTER